MKEKTQRSILSGIFSAIIAIFSWIQIPSAVPFTLQTLGIYLCCGILGGKMALLSATTYIVIGLVGLPVFSGFSGGVGAIFGATGGFIIGFLFIPLSVWVIEKTPYKAHSLTLGGSLGTALCYISGISWYSLIYMKGSVGLTAAFITCVLPFMIPDTVKLIVSCIVSKQIKPRISSL